MAAADVRKVPMVRLTNKGIERGNGESASPVVAVNVIKIERFRFDNCE